MEVNAVFEILRMADTTRQYLRVTFVTDPYPNVGLKGLAKLVKKGILRFRPLGEGRIALLRLEMLIRLPIWLDQRDREFDLLLPPAFSVNVKNVATKIGSALDSCVVRSIR